MRLELGALLAGIPFHSRVTACLSEREHHGLVEERERLDFLDGLFCRGGGVEDNESLAFGFEVLLGDEVDDGAVLREDGGKGLLEEWDLDRLFKVADLEGRQGLVGSFEAGGCGGSYVYSRFEGGVSGGLVLEALGESKGNIRRRRCANRRHSGRR